MTTMVWHDATGDLASMDRHFGEALLLFEEGGFRLPGRPGYHGSMALQHCIQCGYTSAEVALLRVFDALGRHRPSGAAWHLNLIRQLASPMAGTTSVPALSEELAFALQVVRGFRHIAMHVYDDFDIDRFEPVIPSIEIIRAKLPMELEAFFATLHHIK